MSEGSATFILALKVVDSAAPHVQKLNRLNRNVGRLIFYP